MLEGSWRNLREEFENRGEFGTKKGPEKMLEWSWRISVIWD